MTIAAFCKIRGIHSGHIYCPLQSPTGWAEEFNHDPCNLPLRSDDEYRNVATTVLKSRTYNPLAPSKPHYGIAQYSIFYELETIDFPRSFPIDTMHFIFENIVPNLFKWWTGTYLKKTVIEAAEEEPGEDERIDILKKEWTK